MTGSRRVRMALLAAVLGGTCPAVALDLDTPPPPAPSVDLGLPPAGARPDAPRGNPLWAIPLATLSATRERPIFSPSRRPPPAAEDTAAEDAEPDAAPTEAASTAPNLTLVGTIAGAEEGFGIFLEGETQEVLRLRTGETHEGWVLKSVKAREATLSHGENTVTLSLPAHEGGDAVTPAEGDRSKDDAEEADTAAPGEDAEPDETADAPDGTDTASPDDDGSPAGTPEGADLATPADTEPADTEPSSN